MAGIWPRVDCLVHTADTEPFGRVIIESMAAGVPVIAADGGGPSEIIERDVTGILVPPDEEASLAQAMLQMAREPAAAARLALAARRRVMEKFTA
ncbi:MAG: glycosyltransferase, partial [Planctomycetota bacterium]|nr:glycosyltransferase [Planctomycetota bacterium]